MSTTDNDPSQPGVKTLGVRLDRKLHAQLALVAQLRGKTVIDEIRTAIETHIASVKAEPELASKADGVLEEIERDASVRRAAITALFGSGDTPAPANPTSTRRRKAGTSS
jgi:predicted DNA-binding protein